MGEAKLSKNTAFLPMDEIDKDCNLLEVIE
jgi:hypothetical protein